MRTGTANHCFTVQDTRVVAIVPMEDEDIHTAENGYTCGDPTCPCAADVEDESTMPDDIAMYYVPIEERSYDHPGVPAPCWERVDEDEEYPMGQPRRPRGHEWNQDCPCDQCEADKWEDYL